MTAKEDFIMRLARFFSRDRALDEERESTNWEQEWYALRRMTPLLGYQTVAETAKLLTEFLK